uniref:Integrase catalytic domain-containing protein n=1 Tax=Trichuris muris TaxID=70415 RepID=A0A5S6QPH6_TRIMR
MVYTTQQNGIAERVNRTLMDLVRSTLSSTHLPKNAWAELTNTAAYIRNRVTSRHNELKTPFEQWFKRKPSIRHLRVCGCEVIVHVPKPKRNSKLTPRARSGVLVGYAINGKGWRIWMEDTQEVIESRDCVFKENNINMKALDQTFPNVQNGYPRLYFPEEKPNELPNEGEAQAQEGSNDSESRSGEPLGIEDPPKTSGKQQERSHPMKLRDRKDGLSSNKEVLPSLHEPKNSSCAYDADGTVH